MEKIPFEKNIVQSDIFLNALAEAYRLQESIISTTELSIVSTDTKGLITSFNKAAEKLTGYTADEMIGKATPMILHEILEVNQRAVELSNEMGVEVMPTFEVFTIKAKFQKQADRREWTYIRKDGTRFPVLLSITGLWDDHDILIGYAGIATDITEQKIAEQKITQSEAHLQALLNSIDDMGLEVDSHGVCTNLWTRKDNLFFASPREVVIGKKLKDLLSGELLKQHLEAITSVLTTQQSATIEYFVPESDNWCTAKISYINHDKVLILIRSITDKKKGELRLAQSEQKFRTLAENVPGVIFLCRNDEVYSMLYLNDQVKEITGYDAEEFLSGRLNFTQLYHPEDRQRIFNEVDKALELRKKYQLEYRIRHHNGEWRWVEEIGTGVYDGNSLNFLEGFICDITERKKSEEQLLRSKLNLEAVALKLQEQNRQLDEFAHIISHNLRSPVGNIKALIGLLNNDSSISDYQQIFEKLKNVSNNLGETMNELMETLKVKKETAIERVELRFREVFDKVVQSMEGELIQNEAEVTFDFNDAPTLIYSKSYLESIFQNLLNNAIKYRSSQRAPAIRVTTSMEGESVTLRVQDNGMGIDLAKYGDKLFGLHKTFHEHKDARGVGLFLVKTQIEALGGSIWAESEVNKGTTFIIRF